MIIKKLTATFGRLDGETLELEPGLNIISAPNESGKSTWCAFIKSMLYGIDTSQRERNGLKPDKIKFAPIDGKPMRGEMEIEIDGKALTLTRDTRAASSPMREFSATFTGTNSAVPNLAGTDAGLQLLGLTKPVFERSAFVGQNSIAIDSSPDLEKRINSIASTGEEGSSFTEADAFLRQQLRKRRFNKTGALAQVEAEIEAVKQNLGSIKDDAIKRTNLSEQLSAAIAEKASVSETVIQSQNANKEALSEKINALQAAVKEAEEKYFSAREATAVAAANAKSGPYGTLSAAEAQNAFDERFADASKPAPKLWILFFVLAAVFAIAGIVFVFLLIATIISIPAALAWLIASIV